MYFTDFLLEKVTPLTIYNKKYSLGTKTNPMNCHSAINIIYLLLTRVINNLFSP